MWYSALGCIVTLILGLLTAATAHAQPPAKVARIGYLVTGGLASPETRVLLDAFRQGLRERGYVEGQNIVIEYRAADGKLERFPALAAELVQLKPEVIVAQGTPAALAAKDATTTIPIVTPVMGDPVGDGLVASLARPGGNITGLTFLGPELVAKRLELLKEALPRVSRIAALWHPGAYAERTTSAMLQETEAAARTLGVQLQRVEVRGPDELDRAFATMTRERAEALIVLPSAMLYNERRRLVDLAARHRLPAMYQAREIVELGGLIAYGASIPDLIRRSATHVDKILKGAKPADLPVEQATKFELVINLETAEALGLTIPATLLFQADKVIH
jgi:putative tryptophan/tyrosine transport system substrate-binding protein